jgi:hypothetical protein
MSGPRIAGGVTSVPFLEPDMPLLKLYEEDPPTPLAVDDDADDELEAEDDLDDGEDDDEEGDEGDDEDDDEEEEEAE